MRKFRLICVLAPLAAFVSLSSPTRAQISNQEYASPAGTGITCSGSAPCSLQAALALLEPNNEISCINGGFYAANGSIVASFIIDCPGAVLTSVSAPALSLGGTSSQVVILRNLTFDGGPQNAAPFIVVFGGATLIIENCKFQNIANGNAIAIQYLPTGPASQLIIRDSVFINNGIAPGTGGGLQVAPTSGGSASVLLDHVSFNNNVTSMVLNGPVSAIMVGSTVSASRSTGIIAGSGATLDVKGSTLAFNVGSAVSIAAGATVRFSDDDIKSNQVGVSNNGGQALTYQNNRIAGNGSSAALTAIQTQ